MYPLEDWVALNLLPLAPAPLAAALDRVGEPAAIAYRVPASMLARKHTTVAAIERMRGALRRLAAREIRRAARHGVRLVARDDPDYPADLAEIPDPPPVLSVRGRLSTGTPRVALVGSRAATRYGTRVAAELAAALARRGVEIVSGGARGVDAAAHGAALGAGGRSVAVLGSGLLHPYPEAHRGLFERLAATGAVVSEYPLDAAPDRWRFPRRNRLVSGLSAAVVVVEAARRSGALSTAAHALEQGREVLAVPGPITSPRSVGANGLIRDGAAVALTPDDILQALPEMYRRAVPVEIDRPQPAVAVEHASNPSPDEAAVVALLDHVEPLHLDALADRAPFGVARLLVALFGLQIRGTVDRLPGRYYVLRPQRGPS